jgi:hypothetical protein
MPEKTGNRARRPDNMIHQLVKKSNGLGELKYCRHAMRGWMSMALSVTPAAVRSLTAVSWVTLSWRIILTAPSAVFGTAVAKPARTAHAACSESGTSDLPASLRIHRSGWFTPTILSPCQRMNELSPEPYVPSIPNAMTLPKDAAQSRSCRNPREPVATVNVARIPLTESLTAANGRACACQHQRPHALIECE